MREMVDLGVDTAGGLDLCITSWALFPVFGESDSDSHSAGEKKELAGGGEECARDTGLGMGLGLPDFVRKPWSRDAGGCIILPRDRRRSLLENGGGGGGGGLEVLVQLKTEDMETLMRDGQFMGYVDRVTD